MLYKKAVQIKRAWDTGFYYRTNKNNWKDGTDTVPEALRTAWDNMGAADKWGAGVTLVGAPTYLVSKLNARKLKKQLDSTLKSTNADDALVKTLNRQLRWNISRNIDSALHAAKYGTYKTGQGLAHATGFKGLEKLFGYSAPKGRGLIKSLFNLARGKVF